MSTELRPTPETEAAMLMLDCDDSCVEIYTRNQDGSLYRGNVCRSDKMAEMERERDSAKTLSRSLLDQLEAQAVRIEAMREAIKEACEALADLSERWEETPEWHNMAEHNSAWCGKIFTNVRQCKKSHDALAKLKPLLP